MSEEVKGIYWIQVYDRQPGTLDTKRILEEYPFPDVPFEPFGFDLLLFEQQIGQIKDELTRLATLRRFQFIRDIWHPDKFFRIVRKPWKYAR